MDQNVSIVQTLFNRYSDDQKSMLLQVIQNSANGSHEADVVYADGGINLYSQQGAKFYRQSGLTEDQVQTLRAQVVADLTNASYDFHLPPSKPPHHDAPGHHHGKK